MGADAGIPARLDAESSPAAGENSAVESPAAWPPTRLLVVVPDDAWRERLAAALPSGDVVITTACETDTPDTASRVRPDVVLLLLHGPHGEASRREALRHVVPGAGLVVIDEWPTMASALEALRLGAYAYLPWPQSAATLTSKVRAAHNLGLLLAGCGEHSGSSRDEPPRSPEPLPALAA